MGKYKRKGRKFLPEDGWKEGDKVRCTQSSHHRYEVSIVYTLQTYGGYDGFVIMDSMTGQDGEFVLVGSDLKGFAKWIKEIENV